MYRKEKDTRITLSFYRVLNGNQEMRHVEYDGWLLPNLSVEKQESKTPPQ